MSPQCRPADLATLRRVLGSYCSDVTVVAALGREGPLGLTCQASASLSHDRRVTDDWTHNPPIVQ